MARIDLTSIGIRLYYGEGTENVKPASWADYIQLTGLKEIPEMNPAPDTIDATTFDEEEYKVYVEGLKDVGGSLGFTFNMTQEFIDNWDALLDAIDELEGDLMWFLIDIPELNKVFCFRGKPVPIGLSGVSVNALLEITAYITPVNEPRWESAPPNLTFSEAPNVSLNGNVISWDSILNANKYKVYRSATSGGARTLVGITTGLEYNLSFLGSGTHYITVDAEGRHYNPKKSAEKTLVIS